MTDFSEPFKKYTDDDGVEMFDLFPEGIPVSPPDELEGTDGLTDTERTYLANRYRERVMKPLTKEEAQARMNWLKKKLAEDDYL